MQKLPFHKNIFKFRIFVTCSCFFFPYVFLRGHHEQSDLIPSDLAMHRIEIRTEGSTAERSKCIYPANRDQNIALIWSDSIFVRQPFYHQHISAAAPEAAEGCECRQRCLSGLGQSADVKPEAVPTCRPV